MTATPSSSTSPLASCAWSYPTTRSPGASPRTLHPSRSTRAACWRSTRVTSAQRPRAPSLRSELLLGRRLDGLREEVDHEAVERLGPLEHRDMPGVVQDHLARVRDPSLELVGVLHRNQVVVTPPYEQHRHLDVLEPVAEVVVGERIQRRQEPGAA